MSGLFSSLGQRPSVPPVASRPAALPAFLRPQAAWAVNLGTETWAPSAVYAGPGPRPAQAQRELQLLEIEINGLIATMGVLPSFAPAPVATTSLLGDLQSLFDRARQALDQWLAPALTPAQPRPPKAPRQATEFVISSFNVLGSSHTKPGGNKPHYASGPERIRMAVKLLEKHDVDVVGFQEFQADQLKAFLKAAGDEYAVYPGLQLGRPPVVNSIAWRKDTWEMVKPGHIEIPYFHGKPVKMPVVRLRHQETGQEAYFANFHNPASTKRVGDQEKWRDLATDKQIDLVNRLTRETGLPVFVVGDMNEREEYYRRMTKGAPMVSADAGPNGKPPKKMAIDWIFGSEGVQFSEYVRDRSSLVQKATDHPMVVSKARISVT